MKRLLLIILILLCLVSLLVLPSAAEDSGQELVGYLSNRYSGDDYVWYPIGTNYQEDNRIALLPNTVYVIQGVVFMTTSSGHIPSNVIFNAFGYELELYSNQGNADNGYRIFLYNSDSEMELYRPRSTIGIYRYYGNVTDYDRGYQNGYSQGYMEGQDYGLTKGGEDGYARGYAEAKAHWESEYRRGEKAGYQLGLEVAGDGDWRSLFTAVVEAPVNTFQALFNFEVLGLDMRVAFGSFMSLCVLLLVFKKVVM